jgi:hypothetical protein
VFTAYTARAVYVISTVSLVDISIQLEAYTILCASGTKLSLHEKSMYYNFSGKTNLGPNFFTLPYSFQYRIESSVLVNVNNKLKSAYYWRRVG